MGWMEGVRGEMKIATIFVSVVSGFLCLTKLIFVAGCWGHLDVWYFNNEWALAWYFNYYGGALWPQQAQAATHPIAWNQGQASCQLS